MVDEDAISNELGLRRIARAVILQAIYDLRPGNCKAGERATAEAFLFGRCREPVETYLEAAGIGADSAERLMHLGPERVELLRRGLKEESGRTWRRRKKGVAQEGIGA